MKRREYKSFFAHVFVMVAAVVIFFCSSAPSGADARARQVEKTTGEEIAAFAVSVSGAYSTAERTGPDSFDCSGFVYYVMNHFNAELPRGNARTQMTWGEPIDFAPLKERNDVSGLLPGDLIFFDYEPDGTPNHVGIYIGEGKIRHCFSSGVCTTPLSGTFYKGDNRPLFSAVCGIRRIASL